MKNKAKTAFITGITGQDGSYLTELLLRKNYTVHGLIRRASTFNTGRIDHIYQDRHNRSAKMFLHYGDVCDYSSIYKLISEIDPDEIYNLAAQSHVRVSFDLPEYTFDTVAMGNLRILEAIHNTNKKIKFYQASSSEMFGNAPAPQNERTPFNPQSPYGVAKLAAYNATINYRQAYGIFAVNGILFNHESPRRGETFLTHKVTSAVARIAAGRQDRLYLGNLDARRDWGFAPEYVKAMWMMLQLKKADDFVIATGETHTVREFVELAFKYAGLNWKKYVRIDQKYFRPTEVNVLLGDPAKAAGVLKWKSKVKFNELIKIMLNSDFKREGFSLRV